MRLALAEYGFHVTYALFPLAQQIEDRQAGWGLRMVALHIKITFDISNVILSP
jgi:hypothetical protein